LGGRGRESPCPLAVEALCFLGYPRHRRRVVCRPVWVHLAVDAHGGNCAEENRVGEWGWGVEHKSASTVSTLEPTQGEGLGGRPATHYAQPQHTNTQPPPCR
jgi:hypothetical protein